MDGHPDRPLMDSQLDREIESALEIEPSPEFLARVRTRIASEPAPARWRLVFEPLWAVGIVGIVLAIIAPGWLRDGQPLPRPMVADVRLTSVERADLSTRADVNPKAGDSRDAGVSPRVASRRDPLTSSDRVEVIVSSDEQQALQTLLRVAYEGRMPAMPEAARETSIDVPDITIAPLVIDRLPQIARLEQEGESQW